MFRAGWNSAEAVRALRNQAVVPAGKSFRAFAGGMMCGVLMCGVGLTARQFSGPDHSVAHNQVAAINAVVPPVGAESAVLDSSVVAEETSHAPSAPPQNAPLISLSALLMPWWTPSDSRSLDLTPPAARPLSRAARSQWSHMLLPESTVLAGHRKCGKESSGDVSDSPRLRVRSLTELTIDDLL